MKISYISDLHLDFHVPFHKNQEKWFERTLEFVHKLCLTKEDDSTVICIAGDLSHYNRQSLWALEVFEHHFEHVLLTLGNHDYYLVTKNQQRNYKYNSQNRVDELLHMIRKLKNVHPLTSDQTVTIDGVVFGGNTMWYPLDSFADLQFFNTVSNDSELIKGFNIKEAYHQNQKEYESLMSKGIDVMISHVPVINIDSHFKYNSTSCYLTPVKDITVKHWIFGHAHQQKVYEKGYCTFHMNAIGYKDEKLELSIKSFEYKKGGS